MEYVEIVREYISPELLVLVPVMYFIGVAIKKSNIKDSLIPLLLGVISILLTGLYLFATMNYSGAKEVMLVIFSTLTQGVIIAALSVYFNQLYKQFKKN
jgi:1,4-dihydroxy-2-naphthoate octaprenyltransferase